MVIWLKQHFTSFMIKYKTPLSVSTKIENSVKASHVVDIDGSHKYISKSLLGILIPPKRYAFVNIQIN